jgi:hypothetical protein
MLLGINLLTSGRWLGLAPVLLTPSAFVVGYFRRNTNDVGLVRGCQVVSAIAVLGCGPIYLVAIESFGPNAIPSLWIATIAICTAAAASSMFALGLTLAHRAPPK